MSWDLYCYQSASNSADSEEADALINTDEPDPNTAWPVELRNQVVQALIASNPRLERFQPPASTQSAIDWIELNPPEGDLIIQIIIASNHVAMSVPYWYKGEDARCTFAQLLSYARTLREKLGFFAYDPQTGEAFDPIDRDSLDHTFYEKTVRNIPSMIASSDPLPSKKPWWKFW